MASTVLPAIFLILLAGEAVSVIRHVNFSNKIFYIDKVGAGKPYTVQEFAEQIRSRDALFHVGEDPGVPGLITVCLAELKQIVYWCYNWVWEYFGIKLNIKNFVKPDGDAALGLCQYVNMTPYPEADKDEQSVFDEADSRSRRLHIYNELGVVCPQSDEEDHKDEFFMLTKTFEPYRMMLSWRKEGVTKTVYIPKCITLFDIKRQTIPNNKPYISVTPPADFGGRIAGKKRTLESSSQGKEKLQKHEYAEEEGGEN